MTVECGTSIEEKSDVVCVSGFYNPSEQERFRLLEQEVVSRYKFNIRRVGRSQPLHHLLVDCGLNHGSHREQALDQQQAEITKQQDLLDHDRDIGELMGARDLYIADVHDVGRNGQADKTYGRVFYTKGKSLIFYAYDLDQEAGLKDASTFQAWGRRGIDKQQALSLGVCYEDNASKKRWVLKFDDPKGLASIDAVFVTVEPTGGSHHPSGKPLLFAYLRVNPNHP
jgi:hypothetical protein